MKHDTGKPKWSLLFRSMPTALLKVLRVREYGVQKYSDPDNWKTVERERYIDAALRHIIADVSGETVDDESKQEHLAHAVCSLLFALEMRRPCEHGTPSNAICVRCSP